MQKEDNYEIKNFNVKLVAIQDEWKKMKVGRKDDGKKEQPKEDEDQNEMS